jgi:hypothetical protein
VRLPLAGGILIVDHAGLFLLEEGGGPSLGNVHEFINDLFVLLVEVVDLLLSVEVHGLVAQPMHLLDGIALEHSPGTLLPD